jgi:hypothetical protein
VKSLLDMNDPNKSDPALAGEKRPYLKKIRSPYDAVGRRALPLDLPHFRGCEFRRHTLWLESKFTGAFLV